ncbi:hypothetical protein [Propionivibrio sp.]|uniref:hypothetical protein n=1 Tax=Propionivibrio sp. TaxID=2212460 RepID=UPI003BF38AB3
MFFLYVLALAFSAAADDALSALSASSDPQLGDCVMFREGGVGLVLKTPTYWLKGTVAKISHERRQAGRCPEIGKLIQTYTRDDWVRMAAAMPCVDNDSDVREVDVLRLSVSVEEWETPWSKQHGTTGWLFRGYFLDKPLKQGGLIDMDATWLEHCEPRT